jgi:hypothetical protein
VDQQQPEKTSGATSAESRAEWTEPQVDRLIAGGAETGPAGDVDGADTQS